MAPYHDDEHHKVYFLLKARISLCIPIFHSHTPPHHPHSHTLLSCAIHISRCLNLALGRLCSLHSLPWHKLYSEKWRSLLCAHAVKMRGQNGISIYLVPGFVRSTKKAFRFVSSWRGSEWRAVSDMNWQGNGKILLRAREYSVPKNFHQSSPAATKWTSIFFFPLFCRPKKCMRRTPTTGITSHAAVLL